MTRVAYLINQYPKVSHSFIRREIEGLERAGVDVVRLAIRGWDAEVVDPRDQIEQQRTTYLLTQNRLQIVRWGMSEFMRAPGRFVSVLGRALRMGLRADKPAWFFVAYFAEACIVLHLMRQAQVTHLHSHFGTNGTTVALLAAWLGGITYSFTVHGPEEFDKPEFIHLGPKIENAAFVAAITSYCRSQLYRWVAPQHWPKVQEIHCGLEAAFHENRVTAVPDVPQFVCIGRLCEQKGQLLLVQAAAKLAATGRAFKLVLAGDGELRPLIEQLIAEHQLQAHVSITGWISSDVVRELLLESRAMVLPSFAEGLPVVIMEALSLQRPVITTSIAGIPELVVHGVNGWLITPGSIDALTQAMAEALDAPLSQLQQYGQAGRVQVLARHDVDQEAHKLANLFRTLC